MDLTSSLLAYDEVLADAKLEGREPNTADRMHAMRAAIEAYEDERKHVITPSRGTGSRHDASTSADVCAEMRALCSACGGTGDVHSLDGEWRGICNCEASAWAREQTSTAGSAKGGITEQLVPRTDDFGTVWMVTPEKAAEIDDAIRGQGNG